MKASTILSLVSWLNIYALVWTVLLYPPIRERVTETILAFVLFFLIAAASTSKAEKKEKEKNDRENQPS